MTVELPECRGRTGPWKCHRPVYEVPLVGHKHPDGEQVMFQYAYCKDHAQDIIKDDWFYCPECGSCGIGGCCPKWCWLCGDRHDKDVE